MATVKMYSFTWMAIFLGAVSVVVSEPDKEGDDLDISDVQRRMLLSLPWPVRLRVMENMRKSPQLDTENTENTDKTDKNEQQDGSELEAVRVKLFKMGYDSVQHSEELTTKARAIQPFYEDEQEFLVGYSFGHMAYQHNEMKEMALNFKKFWHKWSVPEHISAYIEFSQRNKDIKRLRDVLREFQKPAAGTGEDKSREFSDFYDSYKSDNFKVALDQAVKQ